MTGFSFWFKDDAGHSLNVYKTERDDGHMQYGVEAYMEDNGLTTYGNGDTLTEAYNRAQQITWSHLKEVVVLP